ncbi:MAG: DUF3473 domain-containing protein [Candidatus Omnitrophica bacterium]|nr:DUF3473 domain-containing protein [Candidatus Omnitrophota bacterium]
MKIILTFDVEEYYQVENFKSVIRQDEWKNFDSRLTVGLMRILRILDDHNAKATFFVLGCVAEKRPDVIRHIAERGHEIASHGYGHELVYKQTQEEYKKDVERSLQILGTLAQKKIRSYRAPCFSISRKTMWAYDVIKELGIEFDSSLFPMHHDHYGLPSKERYPYVIKTQKGQLQEIPISTAEVLGKRIPFAGGGYFRMLPLWVIKKCMQQVNAAEQVVNMYFHPWEFDPEQPRITTNALAAFRHYINLDKTESKLRAIMSGNEFMTIAEYGDSLKV